MIVENLRSMWTRHVTTAEGDPSVTGDEGPENASPRSKLFSCPQCDVVYLALEKDVCSSCSVEVQEVSAS